MKHISQITKSQGLYQVILDDGTITTASGLMVLDFNGAANLSYINGELGIRVDDIQMEASLTANAQAQVIDALNASAANGVLYITAEQAAAFNLPANTYSTIYVGDTADLDALGGVFSGIAETTGTTAAATRGDNAFVLTNRITSVEQLVATIAHEAGHLTGTVIHDYANDGATLDDFMVRTGSALKAPIVYSEGIHSCENVSFTKGTHYAPPDDHGGAFQIGGTAIFSGTNVDFSGFGGDMTGGGAFLVGDSSKKTTAQLHLSGATFTQNSGRYRGGAIAAYSGVTVTLNDTIFSSNCISAGTLGGGAMLVINASATVNNTLFKNNSVYGDANAGGAIFLGGPDGYLELSGNTFTGNSASGSSNGGRGGAIYAGEQTNGSGSGHGTKTIKLTGANIFQNNSVNSLGGAIYLDSNATLSYASGADCPLVFTSNMATGSGGAIFNDGTAYLAGATFTNNSATANGGAIYNNTNATVTFTKDLTLATATDTLVNSGSLVWDITDTDATLNGYDKLTNTGTLKIKVDDTMEQSTYVLATGVEASLASNKQTFTLTYGSSTANITVDGADQTIAGNTFSLDRVNGNTLVLTVVSDLSFGQNGASGAASATYMGGTYSGTWGSGQFYTSFSAARDANKKLFIAVNKGETAAISGYVALNGKSMTLSADDKGGSYAGVVMGGERLLASGSTVTSTNLTIERGTYKSNVVGGTYVGGTNTSCTMSGTSNLTIHGGTFTKAIAGGMYAYNKTNANEAHISVGEGNTAVNLTIDGGTFNGRIYGGNYAATDSANDANTSLIGNVVITIDTKDNAVAINNGMDIGCRGTGTVTGSATLTFKGLGGNLTFGGSDKRVNGACNMAYMEDKGGTQTLVSGISGDRRIVFDAFNGNFGGDVTLFKSLEIKNNSKVNFTTGCQDLASRSLLYTIESWTFGDTASEIQGLGTSLDFSGDTLTLSSAANQTLFTGSFTGVDSATAWFSSISAGGLTYNLQSESSTTSATYATSSSETLTLNIGSGKLVVGALA